MLRDIAIVTGGQLISEEAGKRLDEVELADLGRARRVVSDKDTTAIIEGHGNTDEIAARINQIKSRLRDGAPDFDREKLEERVAKLSRRGRHRPRGRSYRNRNEGEKRPR